MTQRLTTPIFGIDSYGATPAFIHHEIGSKFAGRYSSHEPGKYITSSEYRTDLDNDIALISVFEDGATNARGGYDQGKDDALFAAQQTRDAGRPNNRPIFAAVDFDATLADVEAYFDGWAAVLGREHCGPYSQYAIVAGLLDKGFGWAWQTVAWSGGEVDSRAKVLQYEINLTIDGHGIDYNHAYYEDFGQWNYVEPKVVDKHDYERFYKGPFYYKGHKLDERALVEEYDSLRKHPRLNAKKLAPVRADLRLCAERIASLASVHREPGKKLAPAWSAFDRGVRYQLIIARAEGKEIL